MKTRLAAADAFKTWSGTTRIVMWASGKMLRKLAGV